MEPQEAEETLRCFQCQQLIPWDAPRFRRQMQTGVRVSRRRGLVARLEGVTLCEPCEMAERAATEEPPPPPIQWRFVSFTICGAIVAKMLIPQGEWLFWGALAGRSLWKRWHPHHEPLMRQVRMTHILRHR